MALFLLFHHLLVLHLHFLQHCCCSPCRFSFYTFHSQEEEEKEKCMWRPSCFFLPCTIPYHCCYWLHTPHSEKILANKRHLFSCCCSLRLLGSPSWISQNFKELSRLSSLLTCSSLSINFSFSESVWSVCRITSVTDSLDFKCSWRISSAWDAGKIGLVVGNDYKHLFMFSTFPSRNCSSWPWCAWWSDSLSLDWAHAPDWPSKAPSWAESFLRGWYTRK